ncbi:MAG: hypothetical protein GXY85_05650 [Candidatus Brocadiaceae bacterium]|nr:hypothetical protein [Candidatus Brocadiaceae bacterium]
MQALRRSVVLAATLLLALAGTGARAAIVNPCLEAHVRCRAEDEFLSIVYEIDLHNPGRTAADVLLLSPVDTLERVDGAHGDLVVTRGIESLHATVPPGQRGHLTVRLRQRIVRARTGTAFMTRLPMPPAVHCTVEVDLPGPAVDFAARPGALVLPLDEADGRARFQIVPLSVRPLALTWAPRPPARVATYSFGQTHDLAEDPPGFRDAVTLQFRFDGAPPDSLSVRLPSDADLQTVECPADVRWRISGSTLDFHLPEGAAGELLEVRCRLTGAMQDDGRGAHRVGVPVFLCPGAARTEGRVLVSAGRNELTFERLDGAAQTVAEGRSHKLSCAFRRADPVIVVRSVPIRASARAAVETHYAVAAHGIAGTHRIVVDYGRPAPETVVVLPDGHLARSVGAAGGRPDWTQEGSRLRIAPLGPAAEAVQITILTEALADGGQRLVLAPPTMPGVDAADYRLALSSAAELQMTTGGPAEPWRVAADQLPEWLRRRQPEAAYAFRDRPLAVQVEVYPVRAELGGTVQDHATVQEDRILREVLFALEVRRRPMAELCVLLPEGLTAERVDGPRIESWEQPGDGSEVRIRLHEPVSGALHFRLVASEPAVPGRVRLRGIGLRDAAHLKGWFGVGTDVSVDVRPLEDGQTNLHSLRVEQAPDYLKAFENRFLYELFDSRWWLDVHTETVRPVYAAEVLDVLRFRAGQVEATAFVRIAVERGGVGELVFDLPDGAVSPRFEGPEVVLSQGEGRAWRVRFRGRRTGTFDCRVHYDVVSDVAAATVDVGTVRLRGAREQNGALLLLQARPDVEVRPAALPGALTGADPQESYAPWGYRRELPALAAYTYRGADWSLPVAVEAQALSDILLGARIPYAWLDTVLQDNRETLNHLRLWVSNQNRQFLTLDLDALGPKARLIGTYAFNEPIKPFREGERTLQIPLFTSERAARLGMSAIDVIYATPQSAQRPFSRQAMAAPDLSLNVGQFEWTVRVPEGVRLAAVGGNMGRPLGPPPDPSLTGRLLRAVWSPFRRHAGALVLIGVLAAACAVGYGLVRTCTRHPALARRLVPSRPLLLVFAVLAVGVVLAAMLMPALGRARYMACRTTATSNLRNLFMGIEHYRANADGRYPPDLQSLVDDGHLADESLLRWNGQEVVYRRPSGAAAATEVLAYLWPPDAAACIHVLYMDGAVQCVSANPDDGILRNPRTEELIAVWQPERTASAPGATVPSSFGKTAITGEELELAVRLERQTAATTAPGASGPEPALRQQVLDEVLVEAGADQILAAREQYAARNDGRAPKELSDLAPYVADRRLAGALERSAPARGRERRERHEAHKGAQPAAAEPPQALTKQLATDRYNLAMAQLQAGDYKAAESNLDQVLRLDPQHEQARSQLGQAQVMRRLSDREEEADAAGAARRGGMRVADAIRMSRGEYDDLDLIAEQIAKREATAMFADDGRIPEQAGLGGVGADAPSELHPERSFLRHATEPAQATVAAPSEPALRFRTGSLVRQLPGGRSTGALPITIDFPDPGGATYRFATPLLGRTAAAVWFRLVSGGAAMACELALAAAAFGVFLVLRVRNTGLAVPFAALAFLGGVAAVVAAPPAAGCLLAGTALAMALCLVAEGLIVVLQSIFGPKSQHEAS